MEWLYTKGPSPLRRNICSVMRWNPLSQSALHSACRVAPRALSSTHLFKSFIMFSLSGIRSGYRSRSLSIWYMSASGIPRVWYRFTGLWQIFAATSCRVLDPLRIGSIEQASSTPEHRRHVYEWQLQAGLGDIVIWVFGVWTWTASVNKNKTRI